MTYDVRIVRRAAADIETIVRFIADHYSPTRAVRWRAELIRRTEILRTVPDRYPEADEADILGPEVRQLHFGRQPHVYRILYRIHGDVVLIVRVRHAAQDWLTEGEL